MKFTLSWLKEYLQTDVSLPEICHKLNNIGLEVESLEDQAKSLAPFLVAQIITTNPHPDSTKLQICMVDVGGAENLQIICGAKNARSGLKVAYAPIGSTIPANGMVIKKAKIAGVESNGMLCSAAELDLHQNYLNLNNNCFDAGGSPQGGAKQVLRENNNAAGIDGDGIIEIDEKFSIGTKVSEVFGLNEAVIELSVTPNRGDCLGVFGIARDLAASGVGVLKNAEIKNIKGEFSSPIKAKIADEIYGKNCSYFSGFYIKNVKNQPSPKWLKDKLEAVGSNSISAIVDITNYVMLSLNQPLHAYDADKLSGDILVRNSVAGEDFKSLKELNYKLSGSELVIADNSGVIGLAGIIGGLQTAVSLDSKNIFLEAAFFNPENIAKTGRSLNILSDARYRFERAIDLGNVKNALQMAANLIVEICGGEISEVVEAGSDKVSQFEIEFNLKQIQQIIGIEIEKTFVVQTLKNLGFGLQDLGENLLKVQVPSHRNDIKIYQDLVEEIIRIYGLNQITSQPLEVANSSPIQKSALEIVRNKLVNCGFVETINYSFVDQKLAALFADFKPELQLKNPIANQMNYMRPSLIIGLLQNVAKNQVRGFSDLSFLETGIIFTGVNPQQQKNSVAGLRIGKNKQQNHYKDQRNFDVFDVKKDLFDALEILGFSIQAFQLTDETPNYYHPHRSKAVKLGKNIVGYFGELHPLIAKKFDVKNRVNIFELFTQELPINLNKKSTKKAFAVSDLLPVNRDFAFVLEASTPVGDLLKTVGNIDKNLITEINLFDIYHDQKLGDNKKSIAFSIQIQPTEKTLTGEEIEAISGKVIQAVEQKFGGVLRG
jgi:phenylalanyl-tRNA synthetase beta chain